MNKRIRKKKEVIKSKAIRRALKKHGIKTAKNHLVVIDGNDIKIFYDIHITGCKYHSEESLNSNDGGCI